MKAAKASFGLALAGTFTGIKASGHEVSIDLTLSANSALKTVGGAMYVTLPSNNDKMIVVRNSNTEVSAFSSVCTHMGCQVDLPSNGVATCPCHGSKFTDKGVVTTGPALSNLKLYYAQLQGDFIYIDSTPLSTIKELHSRAASGPDVLWHPENETVAIDWGNVNQNPAQIRLIDLQGRERVRYLSKGSGIEKISARNLPKGGYILEVEIPGRKTLIHRISTY
jgi:nitrite reductase/ring-hydroxylating ferredoxin subunit